MMISKVEDKWQSWKTSRSEKQTPGRQPIMTINRGNNEILFWLLIQPSAWTCLRLTWCNQGLPRHLMTRINRITHCGTLHIFSHSLASVLEGIVITRVGLLALADFIHRAIIGFIYTVYTVYTRIGCVLMGQIRKASRLLQHLAALARRLMPININVDTPWEALVRLREYKTVETVGWGGWLTLTTSPWGKSWGWGGLSRMQHPFCNPRIGQVSELTHHFNTVCISQYGILVPLRRDRQDSRISPPSRPLIQSNHGFLSLGDM